MAEVRPQGGAADASERMKFTRGMVSSTIVGRSQNGIEVRVAVIKGSKESPAVAVPQESLFSAPRAAA